MKTQEDFKELIEYVDNWNAVQGVKPCNEQVFIEWFLMLIQNYPDYREVSFDGEGSYFGKQITLQPFTFWHRGPRQLAFEVSYSKDEIRVYKADHNGFWQPEFIAMRADNKSFECLKTELFNFLTNVFGL